MPQRWTLDTEDKRKHFMEQVILMVLTGKQPTVEFITASRSPAQNSAMWLWAEQVSVYLNDAGLDMREVLDKDASIPWTKHSVIDRMWRPIQEAMNGSDSTRDAKKTEVSDIADTITRYLAESQGVTLPPFPSKELVV